MCDFSRDNFILTQAFNFDASKEIEGKFCAGKEMVLMGHRILVTLQQFFASSSSPLKYKLNEYSVEIIRI